LVRLLLQVAQMFPRRPSEARSLPVSQRSLAGRGREKAAARVATVPAALDAFLEGRLKLTGVERIESCLALRVRRQELIPRVTPAKERRVLSLLVDGASQKQIAYEIGVSAPAVSICVRNLLDKLGLDQTLHLILLVRAVDGISEMRLVEMSARLAENRGHAEFAVHVAPDPEAVARLTIAELDVTLAVLAGQGNGEIAMQRRTSLRTVVNQLAAVFRKLGVSGRLELVSRLTLPGSCTSPSARLRGLAAAAAREASETAPTGYDDPSRWMKQQHAERHENGISIAAS
jgi:DNA-binding NarL/FixJ family response regulator